MRERGVLDDELVRTAQELTGIQDNTALIREAQTALVQISALRRLAALGGTMPELEDIPRRRSDDM